MKNSLSVATPIGERLRVEIKKRGISSAELAKRADVKTSFIYDVINGKSANPSTIKLARVAEALGANLAELAGSNESPKCAHEDYVTIPRIMVDISAGSAVVTLEQEGEPYCFSKSWIKEHLGADHADIRMLAVRGDSMEPTLCHNNLVLIDTMRKNPTPPGMFVIFDGFGLAVKRLEYTGHAPARIRILSDNPRYSAYERLPEETVIIGRVAWFARVI